MGSKLGTLNESPQPRSTAGGEGTDGIVVAGASTRRRHSHSRRSGAAGSSGTSGNTQRQRAASTSEAVNHAASNGSTIAMRNSEEQFRGGAPASQRQYSLFGHYWDAFLNSDTSSDDNENNDSDNDTDSSSGSDHNRRRGHPRSSHNRNHQHRHSQGNSNTPFFTATSSNATSANNGGAATNSHALSRASDRRRLRALIAAHSLPFPLFAVSEFKCPICHKTVPSEDIELHVVVCLTKPRIDYNVDVLAEDKGECIICFEEMYKDDTIARLPCLCIYHKRCIDNWFTVRRACPAHPPEED